MKTEYFQPIRTTDFSWAVSDFGQVITVTLSLTLLYISEKALNIWKLTLAETTRPLIMEREQSLPCPFFLLSLPFLFLSPVDACSRGAYKPKRSASFPWKPLLLPQRTRSFIQVRCLPHRALVVQKVDNGILWIIIREGKVRPCREKNET